MLLLYENDNGHIKYHQNLSVVDGLKINTYIYIYIQLHIQLYRIPVHFLGTLELWVTSYLIIQSRISKQNIIYSEIKSKIPKKGTI